MARPKNSSTADETKADKFVRLAKARMGKALKAISQLEALGGSGYESTEEQRAKMVKALRDAVGSVETSLAGKTKADTGFDF